MTRWIARSANLQLTLALVYVFEAAIELVNEHVVVFHNEGRFRQGKVNLAGLIQKVSDNQAGPSCSKRKRIG